MHVHSKKKNCGDQTPSVGVGDPLEVENCLIRKLKQATRDMSGREDLIDWLPRVVCRSANLKAQEIGVQTSHWAVC